MNILHELIYVIMWAGSAFAGAHLQVKLDRWSQARERLRDALFEHGYTVRWWHRNRFLRSELNRLAIENLTERQAQRILKGIFSVPGKGSEH